MRVIIIKTRRIVNMKIFVATTNAEIIRKFYEKTTRKLNVMISYHYLKAQAYKLTSEYKNMIELLYLDSGAYSVFTGRSQMTVYEYRNYISLFGDKFDEIFSFDEDFFDPDHNWENQVYLENNLQQCTKRPIPVIHDSENPLEEIATYVEDGHSYIAMGSNNRVLPEEFYEQVKEQYPDLKLHLFGNLNREHLTKFKPFSADSASFLHQSTFGCFYYWDPQDEKEYNIYVGAKDNAPTNENTFYYQEFHHKEALERFLREKLGFSFETLLNSTTEDEIRILNLYFFKELEDRLNATESSE